MTQPGAAATPPRREPTAQRRQAAANLHGWYIALAAAGFTKEEALTLVARKIPTVVR